MADELTPEEKAAELRRINFGHSVRRFFGLWTPEELAWAFRVEPNTVVAWRRDNTGPQYTRLGRAIFYRDADVQEWIDKNVGREKFPDDTE